MILEQLPQLSFSCYRDYVLIFKNRPSLMWYVFTILDCHSSKSTNEVKIPIPASDAHPIKFLIPLSPLPAHFQE